MNNETKAPTMAWHPETSESRIFNHPSEVPEGWLNTHPSNVSKEDAKPVSVSKEPVKPADADKVPMTRKEIAAALSDGGVAFDPKQSVKVLYTQLTEAVKTALTDSGVEFDPAADTKALLEKLPKPE